MSPLARQGAAAASQAVTGTPTAAGGDAVLALARRHIGESYVLGARAPLANADWHGPWDCAEFASWCVYQASGILFGVEPRHDAMRADAYTGYWAAQAKEASAIIDIAQAVGIAGALLLREPRSRRVGHIAISDGRGGTVEAHSSKKGVIAGTASGRRWDCGILVPGVRCCAGITAPALAPPPPGILRLSEPLLRGEEVARLQACLLALGYGPGAPDSIFGPQTASAVAAFQAAEGLLVDGEVGPVTWAALSAAAGGRP